MKIIILIALVASCLAAPVLRADYAAVSAKVAELQQVVRTALASVVADASADNAAAGANIAAIAEINRGKAREILAEAQVLIDAETLTVTQAEGFLEALDTLLYETEADAQADVAQLSQAVQDKISATFNTAHDEEHAIADDILALLGALKTKEVKADYPGVAAKVEVLEKLVKSSLDSIVSAAKADNAAAGANIEVVADTAAKEAKVILAEAQVLIAAETLTVAQAEALLKQLETLLLKTQADVQADVANLSESVQEEILATFTAAYTQAQAIAQEIYALLAPMSIKADYPGVAAKVEVLEKLVKSSLESIVDAAKADNAAAGANIEDVAAAAAEQAKVILAEAQVLIAAETLTVAQAEELLKQLETLLLKTQADVQADVANLSESVQEEILATFTAAYTQAKAIAQEIYALLA